MNDKNRSITTVAPFGSQRGRPWWLIRPRDCATALLALTTLPHFATAQPEATLQAATTTRGIYNWVHTTGDAERTFPFYRDIFGVELERSPFGAPAPPNAPAERIRSVAEAGSDALVWDLTDTKGSRFRTAFMHAANTPFGLELSEFFDIPRSERTAQPWDPGASRLIFAVRDLAAVARTLRAGTAPTVTLGGRPLETPQGRSLLVRDPDGYLIEVMQASPTEIAHAATEGIVVRTSIGITVADTATALEFYRDLLGFVVRESRDATDAELRLNGLAAGSIKQTTASIPGTDVAVVFYDFTLPTTHTPAANAFRWRIQDVGAPQFQLQVAGLDALLERTKQAGYRFLSVGAKPIQRPFGRFVFAIDPDGVLVEFVEPAAPNVRDFVFTDVEGHLVLRFAGAKAGTLSAEEIEEVVNPLLSTMVHDRLSADAAFEAEPMDSQWAGATADRVARHVRDTGPEFTATNVECRSRSCRIALEHPGGWSVLEHQALIGTAERVIQSLIDADAASFEPGFLIAAYYQEPRNPYIRLFLRRATG